MKRIDHIPGKLASAAPKIALLVTVFAGVIIGASTPASADIQPTLHCEYVGRYPAPLPGYRIFSYFWFWEPGHVNTGIPCGPNSALGNT